MLMSTNVALSHQRGKPDLLTLQTEAAILESLFPDLIEQPILNAIRANSRRLERLLDTDLTDVPEDEAKRLLRLSDVLERETSDLEGALIAARHLQLVYLEIVTATADHWRERYEMKIRLLRDNRNFWKRNCHRLSEQLKACEV